MTRKSHRVSRVLCIKRMSNRIKPSAALPMTASKQVFRQYNPGHTVVGLGIRISGRAQ